MSKAVIQWIGGPVLKARASSPFHVHEALAVGEQRLLGEVIQLSGDTITAQVYEDTTGLRPGDPVEGTGLPLSVALGPGILGHIFDGLLRPLGDVTQHWFKPGLAAKRHGSFEFTPAVKEGDQVKGGQVFGEVAGEGPGRACLVPPNVSGRVVSVVEPGEYAEDATVLVLEDAEGRERKLSMQHDWPVRHPRPSAGRLPADAPMVTGQRILDTLFPVARGGRAALPGGFGTGKTVLQESLAKWCDADIIIYVGCGERGNEMAEVLDEFPELEDPRTGRPLMERTVIIANTSNMPVAAREASIYTAITVAEYFRDQGLAVALMADSTSRWAEALREVSGRLGELPGESGYPAYLASRLADFYERAARVKTLAGGEGSVTVIGAVSPPAGDFSEPVTSHTKRYVRSFWALDRGRAQARFYPAIHPLTSYAEDVDTLARWWQMQGNSEWKAHRRRLLTLLEQQAKLERMARIVGKDALPDEQQMTLLAADLMNEGFLRQSSFSDVDRYCSPKRQTAMLNLMMQFIDQAEEAVSNGISPGKIAQMPILRKLQRLGEEFSEEMVADKAKVATEIGNAFAELEKQEAAHAS
ncbi:V-type ATP synthase subunit A [Thioalkalivibrio sp. XN279]|uniref:V-type ATP synthase subunit A n=1 Tax=Thioalkalivibrio sp. XN279 TaxID=2714953 RepID=UPI00140A4D77|nr:V-type ATP synthase subunit A [Thioalkalivibrio sp. XN279]NHA15423.1 V-type ATP synthase subunit A [Thioalkalivibrio sp. XN279]